MTRMFYTDDEDGRRQQSLDRLDAVAESLEGIVDTLNQANAAYFARYQARQDAKQEFDRSGIPISPLPDLPQV